MQFGDATLRVRHSAFQQCPELWVACGGERNWDIDMSWPISFHVWMSAFPSLMERGVINRDLTTIGSFKMKQMATEDKADILGPSKASCKAGSLLSSAKY